MRAAAAVIGVVAVGLVLAGCAGGDEPEAEPSSAGPQSAAPTLDAAAVTTQRVQVPAPALDGNILGDPSERTALVILPPSYEASDKRYPVVYFLDGWQEPVGRLNSQARLLAQAMLAEGNQELIVVEIDGDNALTGNFYANSPIGGNMEDFVAQDLVAYVDGAFRTIPERTSRGLAGFSMGGFGAVNVGMHRPDVFGAVSALSPGLMTPDGLADMLADNGAWVPYAATFSPDPTATERPFAHLLDPTVPLDQQDPATVAAYESGFGDLEAKVAAYLALPDQLSHIRLTYGTTDSYAWIPAGTEYLAGLLTREGVPHSLVTFDGGHSLDNGYLREGLVAFFSDELAGE